MRVVQLHEKTPKQIMSLILTKYKYPIMAPNQVKIEGNLENKNFSSIRVAHKTGSALYPDFLISSFWPQLSINMLNSLQFYSNSSSISTLPQLNLNSTPTQLQPNFNSTSTSLQAQPQSQPQLNLNPKLDSIWL